MNGLPAELARATDFIARLPGIGRKSALRIAFHFLRNPENHAQLFCESIVQLTKNISECAECHALVSAGQACQYCNSTNRDKKTICVVEQPSDIYAIENAAEYFGLYHVLGGVLSPLDGVGPSDLHLSTLPDRAKSHGCTEIIVATNPSVEGNATANYIMQMFSEVVTIRISRIATGLALGSQIDYADSAAISLSIRQRVPLAR